MTQDSGALVVSVASEDLTLPSKMMSEPSATSNGIPTVRKSSRKKPRKVGWMWLPSGTTSPHLTADHGGESVRFDGCPIGCSHAFNGCTHDETCKHRIQNKTEELSEQVQSFSKTMPYMDYDKALLLQKFLEWMMSKKQDRITLRSGVVGDWDGAYDWDEEGEYIAIKVRDVNGDSHA